MVVVVGERTVSMERFGQVVRLKRDCIAEYESAHREVWPEVEAALLEGGIVRYSIFRFDDLLFAYLEYEGSDFAADMRRAEDSDVCREWNRLMSELMISNEPIEGQWRDLPEVYHLERA